MIGPTEVALILIILLLIFGPSKLPALARSIGEAVREFRKASAEIMAPPPTKVPTEEQLLLETAKKLGIETEGKAIREVAEEILKKTKEVVEEKREE